MICLVELNLTLKSAGLQTLSYKFEDLCFGQLQRKRIHFH